MFGEILGGLSAITGLMGGEGDVQQAPTSGYQTYPQWLKDIYEETAAPAILQQFNKPYEVLPMARYEADPNDPFTSQALLELQAYSDATGGFFNPYGAGQNALGANSAAAMAAQQAAQEAAMNDFRNEMLGRQFLAGMQGQKGYGNVQMQNYTPEELAMFGQATGGLGGLAGLRQAQGNMDFLNAFNAGRLR